MTLNRSFSKLLCDTMRRNIWAIALSLVGFFFCLPLPAAMMIQNRMANVGEWNTLDEQLQYAANDLAFLLGTENIAAKLGMCIMAVLCGIALFSYLHSRQKVDFYHSIPLRRGELFWIHYVSGILMVLPAFLVMYVLAAIVGAVMGVPTNTPVSITGSEIVYALLEHMIFFLCMYTVSVLAAVLTGNTILAVLLDAWMLLSFPAVGLIGEVLGQQYLQNWYNSGTIYWIEYNTSPVVLYFSMTSGSDFWGNYDYITLAKGVPVLAVVLILTLVLAALGYVLFGRRRSERAGVALAFEGVKLPFKCYMVLMVAFVFGIVFLGIGGEAWIWFGLIAGTVLGHVLIEIIYHFDFRAAFAHWKTMIVLAVAAAAIVLGVQNDVMGYDTWLPREDKVASAGFVTGLGYDYEIGYGTGIWDVTRNMVRSNGDETREGRMLTDSQNIAAIRKLAEIGIQSRNKNGSIHSAYEGENIWNYIDIHYEMKNGRIESRSYNIPSNDEVWALLDSIRFTEDYQTIANPLYRFDLDQSVKKLALTVRTNAEPSENSGWVVSDPTRARAIIETLREETLTLTADTAKSTVPVLRIDIRYDIYENHTATTEYVPVYPTFTRTLALLAAEGVQPTALTVDDLASIAVHWGDEYESVNGATMAVEDAWYLEDTESSAGFASVSDKAEMQKLLENAVLEPVAASCDIGMRMRSSESDVCEFSIVANFANGRTCTLYYPAGKFPTALCENYRMGVNNQPAG
ncbi:MAG: hypothetical protein ACI3XZ_03210 [Butyricicoccus sp.]